MINLMYVVLMAMLALNTPTEEELGVKGKSLVEKVKRSLQDEPRKGDEKKDVKLVELNVSEMNAFVIPEKTTLMEIFLQQQTILMLYHLIQVMFTDPIKEFEVFLGSDIL